MCPVGKATWEGMMQICKRCVLDTNFPGIRFDEEGICNYCRTSKTVEEQRALREEYEKRFIELITEYRGKNSYDCIMAYSGGKDSTYTLHLLKNRYDLNILAVTFDNWFQSERAYRNIRSVLRHIHVDHLTITPSFEVFKNILQASITVDLYSPKALERASSICTSCLSMIRYMCFKTAIEKEVPFVVLGLSPGQAPISTSVFKTNAVMIKKMQDAIFQPLQKHVGDSIKPYFLEEKHFEKKDKFPYSINPLAFSVYDEKTIFDVAHSLGWEKPDDTDANSTNCLLNSFANQDHIGKFGYNPYAFEIAELVRTGCLTREEGIKRLEEPSPPESINKIKEIL